jgi:hypothetical protein
MGRRYTAKEARLVLRLFGVAHPIPPGGMTGGKLFRVVAKHLKQKGK